MARYIAPPQPADRVKSRATRCLGGGSLRRSFCFRGLQQRLYCKPSLDVYLYLARNRHAGPLTRTLLGQTETHIKDTG